MNEHIERIQKNIDPLRQQIINHKIYAAIKNIEDLKIFMQYHVYAVWDFMSLLKTLQNNLTCTSVPWIPVGSPETRYLINEIVTGEESDVDSEGNRKSHFEIYLDAMEQCGADSTVIKQFLDLLISSKDLQFAFAHSNIPKEAAEFVSFTFDIINTQKTHLQSAIFTFGREDLIPGMFVSLINELHKKFPGEISLFKYYVERHIEVDGDHHSQLALKMTSNLCNDNSQLWQEAENAIIESLQKRMTIWDGVYNQLQN